MYTGTHTLDTSKKVFSIGVPFCILECVLKKEFIYCTKFHTKTQAQLKSSSTPSSSTTESEYMGL